jgi:hypothetical protein
VGYETFSKSGPSDEKGITFSIYQSSNKYQSALDAKNDQFLYPSPEVSVSGMPL